MFWASIIAGLKVLQFWQTYVVGTGMAVIVLFPKLFFALLTDRFMYGNVALSPMLIWYLIRHHWISGFEKVKDRAYKGRFAGGFTGLLLIGLAEFVGAYFAVVTLLPLMLGTETRANWALPWTLPFHNPVLFMKTIGALLVVITILTQLPILGEMLVAPVMVSLLAYFLGATDRILLPNISFACGFVLAGIAFKYAIIGFAAAIVAFMPANVTASSFAKVASLLFLLLLPVLNLLPAFFYAGWLSQQTAHGF